MTTGTLSGGICFATQAAAARHECSLVARSAGIGATCFGYAAGPSETAGGPVLVTLNQRWQTTASGSYTGVPYQQQLQSCELEDYWPFALSVADGLLISGAVISCWIIAFAWRASRRALDA